MPEEATSTEQRILLTAIDCINEQGINHVTVRMIAEKAGVNIAAVNYYFRSKEKLMERAMELAISNLFEDVDEMLRTIKDGRILIMRMLGFLLWGIEVYPGITRSFLYAPVAGEESVGPMLPAMQSLVTRLRDRLTDLCPNRRKEDLEAGIMAAFSTILMGGVVPGLFSDFTSAGFGGEDAREQLIAELTNMVVG